MMILLLSAINLFKFSFFGVFLCCTDSEEELASEIDIRGQDMPIPGQFWPARQC